MKYLKSLNWSGWSLTMLLCCLAAVANENVSGFIDWLIIVLCVGFPLSLFILIAGRKKDNKLTSLIIQGIKTKRK